MAGIQNYFVAFIIIKPRIYWPQGAIPTWLLPLVVFGRLLGLDLLVKLVGGGRSNPVHYEHCQYHQDQETEQETEQETKPYAPGVANYDSGFSCTLPPRFTVGHTKS